MFHLTTHAFFKALLFLGAGSVIIACHHEQDIWKMGGLGRKMPVTFWTFLAGTLALAGVWPLSGFFSKDAILAEAFERHHYALFALGVMVALLTTFYMFRLVFVVFFRPAGPNPPATPSNPPRSCSGRSAFLPPSASLAGSSAWTTITACNSSRRRLARR
jgi:NADH:ubiquinone oxidoreductase subunit 5 (subunit L)/multisubunit Na+/H+ antiporter MnhA subunit